MIVLPFVNSECMSPSRHEMVVARKASANTSTKYNPKILDLSKFINPTIEEQKEEEASHRSVEKKFTKSTFSKDFFRISNTMNNGILQKSHTENDFDRSSSSSSSDKAEPDYFNLMEQASSEEAV